MAYAYNLLGLLGGFGPNGTSQECFAFQDCQWVKTSRNLASKRRFSSLASVDTTAYVIGGEESSKVVHPSIERLGGEPQTFSLDEPTSRHCAVVHRSGLVLVVLVGNDPFSAKVVEVDPANKQAIRHPKLNQGKHASV